VIHLNDVQSTPWRNGGGVTHELLAWPSTQDWLWRMSVASIERSGPFSRFDGVQRWFAVLSGAGVALRQGARRDELTLHSAPFCFDGETVLHCELLDGATQDFNLMLRRDKVQGQMTRLSGDRGVLLNSPKIVAVYALASDTRVCFNQQALNLPAHSLVWQSLDAGSTVRACSDQALWMEMELLA
jgi:environmental stress-induced protein Ves